VSTRRELLALASGAAGTVTVDDLIAGVDFDAAIRDRTDPLRLAPAYDSGDHVHPNDAGMAVLAAAVPLRLFR